MALSEPWGALEPFVPHIHLQAQGGVATDAISGSDESLYYSPLEKISLVDEVRLLNSSQLGH